MLEGRRIVLGVSGGVAAYKAAYLARRLVERGAEVRSIVTEASTHFLGPQTLAAITGVAPVRSLFGQASASPHTELARWAECFVVAPATASTISRLANGLSDDPLTATVLAATTPLVVAPAMHTEMWEHPATQRNIATLRADGATIVGPESGDLAGGDVGMGRMSEPEDILEAVYRALGPDDLSGWVILVTAGGTREPIDPVRFIANRSSGKMGNAIAIAAARRGARVVLVTAAEPPGGPAMEVVRVDTAAEMAEAVWSRAGDVDVAVFAAAVADFRPGDPSDVKVKRSDGAPELTLVPTEDVLAGVAGMDERPFLVGFAAETGSLEDAEAKAMRKGVDLLVANDVTKPGSGFGTDTNEVTLITPGEKAEAWSMLTKNEVADRLWDRIVSLRTPS